MSVGSSGTVFSTLFTIDGTGRVIGNYPAFIVNSSGDVKEVENDVFAGYRGIVEIGTDYQPIEPALVLSSRGGNKIGVLEFPQSIVATHPLNDVAELSFDIYKEVDGNTCSYWDSIKDFKFIWIPYDNTWFEAHVTLDEENDTVKHVTCIHANEAELSQLNLYETEINTESDIARDDYEPTYFYDENNPSASLLDRILADKAPHYSIYHVDDTLKGLFRVFSFDGTSIHDALNQIAEEVNCLFVYGEWGENDGEYHRTISAYDLEDYCIDCGKRGNYSNGVCTNCGSTNIVSGYGEDTGIFVSVENLTESINYSTNVDSVKNCFRLVGGDDVMTAAIKSCNPSMSQYIWYFSDDMLEDMSNELSTAITAYNSLLATYKTTQTMNISRSAVNRYNTIVQTYQSYNDDLEEITYPILGTANLLSAYYNALNLHGYLKSTMMPASQEVTTTTAAAQLAILQSGTNMSEVAVPSTSTTISSTTANSAVQSYAKVYIDNSRYKVTANTSSISGTTWNGTITVKSYSDDEDTASASFTITFFDDTDNTRYTKWVEQKAQKAMANREATDISVVNLFDPTETVSAFTRRIKLYSLDYLSIMLDMATSAITVMTEEGLASDPIDDIYEGVYLPYYNKSIALQAEVATREQELAYILQPTDEDGNTTPAYPDKGLIDLIVDLQNTIRTTLDLQTYLGDTLWEELSFYRREDQYSNSNYVSDGLTDTEIIAQAERFYESAEKEIVRASTIQNTLSATLKDFLLMPEFFNLQYKFKTGNWIRLKVDDSVYKLRITNWTLDWDDIENLEVEFSDVVRCGDVVSDVESILSKSSSIATTYDYTARQADKGKEASVELKVYHDSGLDFSRIKAISSRGNTNIVYDKDGILLKRVDVNIESPEQARIYNNGIYITKDAWETVSTGLGHFSYVDPETGDTVETYGIIADTVIGKLILGDELKIYSESGRLTMGDDGLTITANDGETNTGLFTIQKYFENGGDPYVEKYIYVDSDGSVVISADSVVISGQPIKEYIDDRTWTVNVKCSAIDIVNSTATLAATVYKNNVNVNTGFTLAWYKDDTLISGQTGFTISITDLDASYTCVVTES